MKKYKSPMKIAHRKHIYLDSNDPRAQTDYDLEKYRSRSGAKLLVKENRIVNIPLEEEDKNCFSIGSQYTNIDSTTQSSNLSTNNSVGTLAISRFDSEKNMIFAGIINKKSNNNSDNKYNIIITKFSSNKNLLWQKILDSDSINFRVKDVQIDKNNDIYFISETLYGDDPDIYIFKYSKNGDKIWSKRINFTDNLNTSVTATNLHFNNDFTKIYAGINFNGDFLGLSNNKFYLYEINCNSGEMLRSKMYYDEKIYSGPYSFWRESYSSYRTSICYANENIYIFGEIVVDEAEPENGVIYKYKYVISKINLLDMSVEDEKIIIQGENPLQVKAKFGFYYPCPEYETNTFFDKKNKKIYFAPRTNYKIIFYELDIDTSSIFRHDIMFNDPSIPNTFTTDTNITGISKNLSGELLISGWVLKYSGHGISFFIKYNPKTKKVIYFNIFDMAGSDYYGIRVANFSINGSRLLFSSKNNVSNPGGDAAFAFNIPSYSLIQKNNKTIEAPGFNSDTHKISVTKFTKFLIPTGEFLVQDVEKLTAYDSLSYTYGDFSCPEYTNNDLYTYVFTDF